MGTAVPFPLNGGRTVDFFKEVARVVVPKDKADHYHALRNRMAAFLSGNTRNPRPLFGWGHTPAKG